MNVIFKSYNGWKYTGLRIKNTEESKENQYEKKKGFMYKYFTGKFITGRMP